ncbi:MAG TPA: DUF2181 domain-containing protein [Candidatus Xenobia bacterium]
MTIERMLQSPHQAARKVHDLFIHGPRPAPVVDGLVEEARQTASPATTWGPAMRLDQVRNAHNTNRASEMKGALEGNYNCLEGDVRLAGSIRPFPGYHDRPVITAHDVTATDGFTLQEWLRIGLASGRGLKLDIKEGSAVPEIIRQLRHSRVPAQRLILNGGVDVGGDNPLLRVAKDAVNVVLHDRTTLQDFTAMRAAFPQALIALSPSTSKLDTAQCDKLARWAKAIGGPVMFVLDAQYTTPETVQHLKAHGHIALWNDPKRWKPGDVEATTQRFRDLGVDGVIDLRNEVELK